MNKKTAKCLAELLASTTETAADIDCIVYWHFPHVPPNPFPAGSALAKAFDAACEKEAALLNQQEAFIAQEERGGPTPY